MSSNLLASLFKLVEMNLQYPIFGSWCPKKYPGPHSWGTCRGGDLLEIKKQLTMVSVVPGVLVKQHSKSTLHDNTISVFMKWYGGHHPPKSANSNTLKYFKIFPCIYYTCNRYKASNWKALPPFTVQSLTTNFNLLTADLILLSNA